jgi:hypothetical protein
LKAGLPNALQDSGLVVPPSGGLRALRIVQGYSGSLAGGGSRWYTGIVRTPRISHDRREESPEAKARWFQSLSVEERMDYLVVITELALSANPDLAKKKELPTAEGPVLVLRLPADNAPGDARN